MTQRVIPRARRRPARGERGRQPWACVLGALLALSPACGPRHAGPPQPGLLLVTVDTLRADHLGLYGHGPATSPRLDAFADSCVVFEHAQAPASWTLPSLGTLVTGLPPLATRLDDYASSLPSSVPTLADLLGEAGFATAGVGSHVFLDERFGLTTGFEHYDDELILARAVESHKAISSVKVTEKGLALLEELAFGARPWFLWLHYFDPHADYLTHAGYDDFGTDDQGRYQGEIAFTDHHLGRVLAALDELGLDDTVVVFTADHGEEFGDHGGKLHGATLYEEVLRVPLLVRAPGVAPRRVEERVALQDVLPTVLELLGVDAPALPGRSLVPVLRGAPVPARPYLSSIRLLRGKHQDCLVADGWKLIAPLDGDAPQLYDLGADPGERTDLAAREPERLASLRALLEEELAAARALAPDDEAPAVELSGEEVEALQALGYAGDE